KLAVEDVCALPRTVDELPVGAVKSRSKAALQMAAPACGLDFESLGRVPDRVSALVDDVAASRGPALAPGGVVRKPRKQRGRARHAQIRFGAAPRDTRVETLKLGVVPHGLRRGWRAVGELAELSSPSEVDARAQGKEPAVVLSLKRP